MTLADIQPLLRPGVVLTISKDRATHLVSLEKIGDTTWVHMESDNGRNISYPVHAPHHHELDDNSQGSLGLWLQGAVIVFPEDR